MSWELVLQIGILALIGTVCVIAIINAGDKAGW